MIPQAQETEQEREDRIWEQVPEELRRAEALREKGDTVGALEIVSTYMDDHFDDVPALMSAAHLFFELKKIGLAHALLKRAAQLEQRASLIWNNLGLCYQEGANLDEGEAYFFRALKINPRDSHALSNLGQLYINQAQPQLAIKHLERALAIDPDRRETRYNYALANLMLHNWQEGWANFDADLGPGRIRKERVYAMIPRWNGTNGRVIIAYGEQGVGDEISFASCIPDLMKENKVIIDCDKRLMGLFKRSFGLETHGTRFEDNIFWLNDPDRKGALRRIDSAVAFGSLPQFYRNRTEDFPGTPYLVADPQRRLQWRALLDSLGSKLKIGIAWTGGNKNTGKHRRSLELDDLMPILNQNATFISLQYKKAPEIAQLEKDRGIKIHHWPHALHTNDYDDTAALVAELDLVISVTTAVIHLSGALGKECWAMAPKAPRWFYGLDSPSLPWYKSVKLYRQKGEWLNTIAEVATDLRTRINQRG